MGARLPGVLLAVATATGAAAGTPAWPPPPDVETRMHALQAVIDSATATPAQREAARTELGRLLMSPEALARGATAGETTAHPPRAAIEPYPSTVKPLPPPPAPAANEPGRARLELARPPAPVVDAKTGRVIVPTGKVAIDPKTSAVLHEVPGGYVDPRTGQFIPR